jgi:tetratricopeptide (TPR) repeat protein
VLKLSRRSVLLVLLVALAVRLVHLWQIRRAPFFDVLMGDARAYDEWARQIAGGDWIGRDVFYQAPLYPYFLGLIYRVAGHDLLAVRLCQAIVGSASCVLLALAASRIFSRSVGLIAGLALALYAPAIFFDGLVQKSVLDVFFVCLMLWLISRIISAGPASPAETPTISKIHARGARLLGARSALLGRAPGARGRRWRRPDLFWLGVAMGGLSLTRENAMVFIAVIVGWTLVRRDGTLKSRIGSAGAFAIGLALVLVPVAARNALVGGGFYVTTSQFGTNFYIGNHAGSDGTYAPLRYGRGAPEYERQDATELAERSAGRPLTPAEVSSYWTGRALDFIRSRPGAWLRLVGRKLALVWNAAEMLDTESQETYGEWSTPLKLASWAGHFGVLVPLAFLGMCATWSDRRRLWVFHAMIAGYAASVVLFYVFARYRYPLVPLLMLFAAAALASAISGLSPLNEEVVLDQRRQATRPWQKPWWIAGAAIVAVGANWPLLSKDLMRAITETNLATALQAEGRLDEADAHYRRAIAFRSDYAPAYNNLGSLLRARGQNAAAISTFEQALALEPGFSEVDYNLANALMEAGTLDQAVDHFRRALKASPDAVDIHNNLGIALANQDRVDEAIAEFRIVLGLDRDSAQAHRNLGSLLLGRHEIDEAIVELGAALRLMPESADAHNDLGVALASRGRLDEAIEQFHVATTRRPDFVDAERNLAMALQARSRTPRPR